MKAVGEATSPTLGAVIILSVFPSIFLAILIISQDEIKCAAKPAFILTSSYGTYPESSSPSPFTFAHLMLDFHFTARQILSTLISLILKATFIVEDIAI